MTRQEWQVWYFNQNAELRAEIRDTMLSLMNNGMAVADAAYLVHEICQNPRKYAGDEVFETMPTKGKH